MSTDLEKQINKRRTFAIISHPDAGKTTLTEKFLLYGGQLNTAGSVKGKATSKHAVSDWMDIEKERGISVTSSVLQFEYDDKCINILDTPGHQDFSEDTYRTLMAADNAVMVIDAAKGVEPQTRKLFKVVARRGIPIFTFFNKMDRDALDSFELVDQVEHELGIETTAVTWPIGSGKDFRGVYDRNKKSVVLFSDTRKGTKEGKEEIIPIDDKDALTEAIGEDKYEQLISEIELLDGASAEYDQDAVSHGKLSPVFFGSALTNFGVESFLQYFLQMTTPPLPRLSDQGVIDPVGRPFSAFVFKIQANMNKAHRDRVAFMRICSGKFTAGMDVWHMQGNKEVRLSQPQQMMADDRHMVSEAYAGDIIGIFDPGIYSIGDTLCMPQDKFRFGGIPTQEGAIQIFEELQGGMEEVIVGVVGVLQFDVLKYRLNNEYNVEIHMEQLPYEFIRWIKNENVDLDAITGTSDMKKVKDLKGNPLLLFVNSWSVGMTLDRNDGLILEEFNEND